jgi:hypothetical protein
MEAEWLTSRSSPLIPGIQWTEGRWNSEAVWTSGKDKSVATGNRTLVDQPVAKPVFTQITLDLAEENVLVFLFLRFHIFRVSYVCPTLRCLVFVI